MGGIHAIYFLKRKIYLVIYIVTRDVSKEIQRNIIASYFSKKKKHSSLFQEKDLEVFLYL